MYNRYIGNTGKFYRVDDDDRPKKDAGHFPSPPPDRVSKDRDTRPETPALGIAPADITGSLKSMISQFLPEGMELGDLLLILVLLLLYLEKEDEEILIILSVLIFMGFK